jgi:hypothetical protein
MTYYQANTKTSGRYDLSPKNITSSKTWQNNHMYSSSTFMMSDKNVNKIHKNNIKKYKGSRYEKFHKPITKK